MKKTLFILMHMLSIILLFGCNHQSKEDKIFGQSQSSSESYKPITLFGLKLQNASHEELKKILTTMGARYLRTESFSDVQEDYYDPTKIFKNAYGMKAMYAKTNDKFKKIAFYFPISDSSFLLNLMTSKYGVPDKSEINKDTNHIFALWIHKDITVRVDNTIGSEVELSFYDLNNYENVLVKNKKQNNETENQVELFGIKIENVNRKDFRNVLAKSGMRAVQLANGIDPDIYNVGKALSGASTFITFFTSDNRFAACEYKFPSFMNAGQIIDVINMISDKYGKPQLFEGNVDVGPVNAEWRMGVIKIVVERDWPDTTTYLDYIHVDNYTQYKNEIATQKMNTVKNNRAQNNFAI